jgi:hypothetical protein
LWASELEAQPSNMTELNFFNYCYIPSWLLQQYCWPLPCNPMQHRLWRPKSSANARASRQARVFYSIRIRNSRDDGLSWLPFSIICFK